MLYHNIYQKLEYALLILLNLTKPTIMFYIVIG